MNQLQKAQKQLKKHVLEDYELNQVKHFAERSKATKDSPAVKNCFPQCELEHWMDNMVGCGNDPGPVQWFHYGWVGLTEATLPKGGWLCPLCSGFHRNFKTTFPDFSMIIIHVFPLLL